MMRLRRPRHINTRTNNTSISPQHPHSLTDPSRASSAKKHTTKRLTLQNFVHADLMLSFQDHTGSKPQRRERFSALRQSRARLIHEMTQLFPALSEAHQRQNGLFALIDPTLNHSIPPD